MNLTFLTQVTGFLKPFAWVMGEILNGIYWLSEQIGIANIAFCIVVFTIVVKMLMLPLTIKQQKFSKVSAKMNPELQKIQEKYKGVNRNDQQAMMQMQKEQQALYQKYGTSPFGGCLPLLIMLPILFALYRVIYAVPAYVTDVKEIYNDVATAVICEYDALSDSDKEILNGLEIDEQNEFATFYSEAVKEFYTWRGVTLRQKKADAQYSATDLIDIFTVYKTSDWWAFQTCTKSEVKGEDGTFTYAKWNNLCEMDYFKDAMAKQEENVDKIININSMFTLNILDTPSSVWKSYWYVLIIPVLAAGLQMLQTKITMAAQKTDNNKKDDSPMASSMKSMNTIMPLMSGVFCLFLPIGVGIYWITSSGVTILQQLAINKHLDKMEIEDIVQENEEKTKEQYKKMGVLSEGNQTSSIAKSTTKSIATMNVSNVERKSGVSSEAKEELNNSSNPSSISAIANIMKRRDDDK